jgi:hypothetical protein
MIQSESGTWLPSLTGSWRLCQTGFPGENAKILYGGVTPVLSRRRALSFQSTFQTGSEAHTTAFALLRTPRLLLTAPGRRVTPRPRGWWRRDRSAGRRPSCSRSDRSRRPCVRAGSWRTRRRKRAVPTPGQPRRPGRPLGIPCHASRLTYNQRPIRLRPKSHCLESVNN